MTGFRAAEIGRDFARRGPRRDGDQAFVRRVDAAGGADDRQTGGQVNESEIGAFR